MMCEISGIPGNTKTVGMRIREQHYKEKLGPTIIFIEPYSELTGKMAARSVPS